MARQGYMTAKAAKTPSGSSAEANRACGAVPANQVEASARERRREELRDRRKLHAEDSFPAMPRRQRGPASRGQKPTGSRTRTSKNASSGGPLPHKLGAGDQA